MKRVLMPLTVLLAAAPSLAPAQQPPVEGRLAQLYAPRPPAGSAFVRMVNPGDAALKTRVGAGAEQTIGPGARATRYAIVEGGKPFAVVVAGKSRQQPAVEAGTFTTLVVGSGGALSRLDDSGGSGDALKAGIRFYNLAGQCAQARLAVSGGPVVFPSVAAGRSEARAINPVKAELVADCGGKASAPLSLPALKPGDHYSLFLTGTSAAPRLQGQLGGTDTPAR